MPRLRFCHCLLAVTGAVGAQEEAVSTQLPIVRMAVWLESVPTTGSHSEVALRPERHMLFC